MIHHAAACRARLLYKGYTPRTTYTPAPQYPLPKTPIKKHPAFARQPHFLVKPHSLMFFRKQKSTRQIPADPIPDWDDTRWRSHLRATALGTDHHCNIYVEMINADRKEAARLFKNAEETRARSFASSAIRNKKTVTALGALAPLCNALYQRSEPLAGYTSIEQIPDPARAGIVSIVFAASRLQMSYLTDTVTFLREQFGNSHISQVQTPEGDLEPLINDTVRAALSSGNPPNVEVDAEIISSVKEYFGVSVDVSHTQNPMPFSPTPPTHYTTPPQQMVPDAPLPNSQAMQNAPSLNSSDIGPLSPQLSQQSRSAIANAAGPASAEHLQPQMNDQQQRMYARITSPQQYPPPEYPPPDNARQLPPAVDNGVMDRSTDSPVASLEHDPFAGTTEDGDELSAQTSQQDQKPMPEYLENFDDGDTVLLRRYDHLRIVIAV